MVWMPALASRSLILKKRSDFTVGPFFMPSIIIFMNIFLLCYNTVNISVQWGMYV